MNGNKLRVWHWRRMQRAFFWCKNFSI